MKTTVKANVKTSMEPAAMNIVTRIGGRATRMARLVVPDPWVIAIFLATGVLGAAVMLGRRPSIELVTSFAFGFLQPDLLAFGFQMVLVLLTGNAMARAPLVARMLARLADATTTSGGAAALVAFASMAMSLFNWGLGLVGGALLAVEVGRSFARRGLPLNFAAVGAAGFVGIAVWHGGFSGSAPLKVASASAFGPPIPITDTLLSTMNLVITSSIVLTFVPLFWAFGRGPAPEGTRTAPPSPPPGSAPGVESSSPSVGAERLERSRVVLALLTVPLAVALLRHFAVKGAHGVTLDAVILVFLVAGLVLHPRPADYARAFADGARESAGILLQFPLYFGIIAVARDGGVIEVVARAFNDLTTSFAVVPSRQSGPIVTYLAACLINMMVPSGGAQWVVQSPIVLEMANTLQLERAPLVLAFAYGDETTNLLQPFWALPLLSLTGLRARDLIGYTLIACAVQLVLVLAGLACLS